MNLIRNSKPIKYGLLLFLVVILVATFFDLKISMLVYNPNSLFGQILEACGEFPASMIAMFSSVGLWYTSPNHKKWFVTIGYGVLTILFGFMSAMLPSHYFNWNIVVTIVLTICYIGLSYYLCTKIKNEYLILFRKACIIGLLMFVLQILTVTGLKMLWGRERYRNMFPNLELFTPWFLPQGLTSNNEFMSFPSGHSANAAMLIWLTLVPSFTSFNKKLWTIIPIIWIVVVPFSRIIMGAHFLSDVTFGVIITLVYFILLKNKFMKEV
ncbi:MAG: phosphatase PAP2 family protein [Anaerorhabdus sp.]|uniref:phosphatase PAP2 family protein n=1 Tax=Anaerorhabdus sp. TaxID=1872524 RepID=UPI002B210957|nr:phosphatase PAP2 family protein [Anaerorhabdus sp.]MEA4875388.1 phosphatase PAP2 family protein [Anaerorhabdus sp.]